MSGRQPRSRQPAQRAWGWHRLRPEWAELVVERADLAAGDLVLDLGAGTGALTGPLLDAGARVIALELHAGRAEYLRARFEGRRLTVVRADLADLRVPVRPFRVVANPPFDGTNALVRTLLGARHLRSADLVLQRGAAFGLLDQHPPGSSKGPRRHLSLGTYLPPRAFTPPPRVDSVVLQIRARRP